jgi:hypothetical protein
MSDIPTQCSKRDKRPPLSDDRGARVEVDHDHRAVTLALTTTSAYDLPMFERAIASLFALTPAIRYIAFGDGQTTVLRERAALTSASSSESDRFEELLVNPTLLTLTRQRGDIDCGGLRFVIVGYGNFHQLVIPLIHGHVSIAFESDNDPLDHLPGVLDTLIAAGIAVDSSA